MRAHDLIAIILEISGLCQKQPHRQARDTISQPQFTSGGVSHAREVV